MNLGVCCGLREKAKGIPTRPWKNTSMDRMVRLFVVAACVSIVAGLYLEGWARNHRLRLHPLFPHAVQLPALPPPGLPSGLTPWNLPFYAGLVVLSGLAALLRPDRDAHQEGLLDRRAAIGLLVAWAGSAWAVISPGWTAHTPGAVFRAESLTGLIAPQHLLQALGVGLVVSQPLRSDGYPWVARALSLGLGLSVLTFLTQFAHPFVDPWPSIGFLRTSLQTYRYNLFYFGEAMGVLSLGLQATLAAGCVLVGVRSGLCRPGSFTLALGLNALFVSILQDRYPFVLVGLGTGLVADRLALRLRRPLGELELRVCGAVVAGVYGLLYFLVVSQMPAVDVLYGTGGGFATPPIWGLGWSTSLWLGAMLLAAAAGWTLAAAW